jgi:hypothetical protein
VLRGSGGVGPAQLGQRQVAAATEPALGGVLRAAVPEQERRGDDDRCGFGDRLRLVTGLPSIALLASASAAPFCARGTQV